MRHDTAFTRIIKANIHSVIKQYFHPQMLPCVCLNQHHAVSQALRQYLDCNNYSIWNVVITVVSEISSQLAFSLREVLQEPV